MSNIAIQLSRNLPQTIPSGGTLIFDEFIYLAGNASYNSTTGEITLNESGRHIVSWWVSMQSSDSLNGAEFTLNIVGGVSTEGASNLKNGQLCGFAIVESIGAPAVISLINSSSGTAGLSAVNDVKASIVVLGQPIVALPSYGGLYNDAIQIITLTPGDTAVVELQEQMPASGISYITNGLIVNQPGNYRLDFMLHIQSTSGDIGITASVAVNSGFSIPSLTIGTVLTSDFTTLSASTIQTLAPGDTLNITLESVAGGTILFGPVLNASLVATLISP